MHMTLMLLAPGTPRKCCGHQLLLIPVAVLQAGSLGRDICAALREAGAGHLPSLCSRRRRRQLFRSRGGGVEVGSTRCWF